MVEILLFTLTSFLVGLSGAMAPGPLLTVTISDSLKKGFKTGPLLVSGHMIGESIIILLILGGLSWVITSPNASILIGFIGGAVMIFLGFSTMRNTKMEGEMREFKGLDSISKGLITSASNPYFFIWWGTIGAALMLKGMAMANLVGFAAFLVGHWSSDLAWYSIVSFLSSRGKIILKRRIYKIIIMLCGLFLIVVGLYFVFTSLILLF